MSETYIPTHKAETTKPMPVTDAHLEALQGATQEFVLGDDVDAAHSAALKEYRKRDRSDYLNHISSLADQEKSGELDGHFYRNKVLTEEVIAGTKDFLSKNLQRTRNVGKVALVLGAGVGAISEARWSKRQDIRNEERAEFSKERHDRAAKKRTASLERKHMLASVKQADQDYKAQRASDKSSRKKLHKKIRTERRVERLRTIDEKTLGRVRKIGRATATATSRIYQAGLEASAQAHPDSRA